MRHWRWGVLLAGTLAAASLPAVVGALPVHDPGVAPSELRRRIISSAQQPYQGYAESRGGLRLPDLRGFTDEVQLFGEVSRLRTWFLDGVHWRVDRLNDGGEVDQYRQPDGVWQWDSGDRRATFTDIPPGQLHLPRPFDLTPPELGRRLASLATDAELRPLAPRRIAGRTTAGIRIVASSPTTTVDHVDIWADPASGLPVRVEVTARGGGVPSLESGFLDLSLTAPSSEVVRFATDAGDTGVRYRTDDAIDPIDDISRYSSTVLPDSLAGLPRRSRNATGVATYGTGFDVVGLVAIPDRFVRRSLRSLAPVPRPWGGDAVVVSTPLLNLEIVTIDRTAYVLGGSVTLAELDRIAGVLVAQGGVR